MSLMPRTNSIWKYRDFLFCVHFTIFKLDHVIKLYVFKSYLKKKQEMWKIIERKHFFFSISRSPI